MSSQVFSPRQGLNARQSETVDKLLVAGLQELELVGAEALTIRSVASRAAVSPATAYTYFASKNHLFAELFLREVVVPSRPNISGRTPTARVRSLTRTMSQALADSPAVAGAASYALLASEPDVQRLRLVIGTEFFDRFTEAVGADSDPALIDTLVLAFSGALLQAGMGFMTYADLGDRLDAVVATIMKGNAR